MKMIFNFISACICMMLLSCSKDPNPAPQPFRYSEQIVIDGIARTYIVKLPKNYYDSTKDRPLVIGLHGTGGSASQFETDYGFNDKADATGFVALYPDGVLKDDGRGFFEIRTWNAGSCCDYAMYNNINDVKFISTVIDAVCSRFAIDKKRVYVAGMSNGGMMTYRLASELPHKIAAIASVSGPMVAVKDLSLQGSVPIIHFHSIIDTKVPYNGGVGIGGVSFPPAIDGINYWVNRNGCDPVAMVHHYTNYEHSTWHNDFNNKVMELYLTYDGGHAWPGGKKARAGADDPSTAVNATNLIWEFLNKFSLP
ncbi:phospholipase [Niastella caeni]|uniref:Phospholipase n=1 Tax=Niastella caeni TaxID=2569763 RepID=A0A4S8HW44_9BACT|nr:PHB depolymerase family esterase [Niastella caeni]THU39850.1 phospholipase [Niastella caeni]